MWKIDIAYTGNDWTERCFSKKGYEVRKIELIEGISGTIIRKMVEGDEDWKKLVPIEVVEYLEKINIIDRIKKNYS